MPQVRHWLTGAAREITATPALVRKPYARPEIVLELELETRAGSPLVVDPLLDPFGAGNLLGSEEKK